MQGIGRRDDLRIPYPGPEALIVCISAFGTKRTSRQAQPMSAFGGKADIGRRSLNGRASRKRLLAKKLRTQKGSLFCVFKTEPGGPGWVFMLVFPIARLFRFCFFHAAQTPLRVSQNDSSASQFFWSTGGRT